jgi:hypothetical protein
MPPKDAAAAACCPAGMCRTRSAAEGLPTCYQHMARCCCCCLLPCRTVQDQITAGLKPYRDWQDPGQEQLVALQVRLQQ